MESLEKTGNCLHELQIDYVDVEGTIVHQILLAAQHKAGLGTFGPTLGAKSHREKSTNIIAKLRKRRINRIDKFTQKRPPPAEEN
jgi:hypothetical protein